MCQTVRNGDSSLKIYYVGQAKDILNPKGYQNLAKWVNFASWLIGIKKGLQLTGLLCLVYESNLVLYISLHLLRM